MITDGQSQDDVAESAQRLRDAHVLMFAIGVTNLIDGIIFLFSTHFSIYFVQFMNYIRLPAVHTVCSRSSHSTNSTNDSPIILHGKCVEMSFVSAYSLIRLF